MVAEAEEVVVVMVVVVVDVEEEAVVNLDSWYRGVVDVRAGCFPRTLILVKRVPVFCHFVAPSGKEIVQE